MINAAVSFFVPIVIRNFSPGMHFLKYAYLKPFVLMTLLALQLATLPKLVRAFGDPNSVITACILLTEAMKVFVCCVVLFWSQPNMYRTRRNFEAYMKGSLATAGPAAVVFSVQNIAISHAQRNVDGITFNILNQSKLLSAAVMGYFILGRVQTIRQMFALILLFSASVLAIASTPRFSIGTQNEHFGVVAAIIGSSLSGLSGALSDLAMQKKSRDAFLFSAEISAYVFVTTVIGLALDHVRNGPLSDISRIRSAGGLFAAAGIDSITSPAIIPILSAAWGGILVGQVTKLVGSVRKGFAVCAGIVLTALIEADDRRTTLFSIMIAVVAVGLYSSKTH
jgi:UDP-sugar transporter A1/2/3